jgi:hypothetical protein
MKVIDVNNPEQILEAKRILDDSQDLQSFINSLGMHNNIFIKNDIVIPFSIKNELLFIVAEKEQLELILNALESINYNIDSLIEIPILDVYNGKLEREEYYFIINSEYKIKNKERK